MEKRFLELKDIECRSNEDKSLSLSGYAIRFNEPSGLLYGEFVEYIQRGAFDDVDMNNVFMLYNHNSDHVLGNTRSSTLDLSITKDGLKFCVDLPNTTKAKEVHELVKRGDINGMSFGFSVESDFWNMTQEPVTRTITKIKELVEISVVPFPAYDSTEVDARTKEHLTECLACREDVKEILNNPITSEIDKLIKEVE